MNNKYNNFLIFINLPRIINTQNSYNFPIKYHKSYVFSSSFSIFYLVLWFVRIFQLKENPHPNPALCDSALCGYWECPFL